MFVELLAICIPDSAATDNEMILDAVLLIVMVAHKLDLIPL